jgi:hypothetical protein
MREWSPSAATAIPQSERHAERFVRMEPGMNAQLYTLRDVTRLRTGSWTKFLRTTAFRTLMHTINSLCVERLVFPALEDL